MELDRKTRRQVGLTCVIVVPCNFARCIWPAPQHVAPRQHGATIDVDVVAVWANPGVELGSEVIALVDLSIVALEATSAR